MIGARLAQAGYEVALIARGDHLAALRRDGLTIADANGTTTLRLPVGADPAEVGVTDDDIVLVTVKSQHTDDALTTLRAQADPVVVCVQNGVANERAAARRFRRVQAVPTLLPAGHLEPGVVVAFSTPVTGLLDVGRYPDGIDDDTERIAAAFASSTFDSVARPDVMRWKYAKLRMNLANVLAALAGPDADTADAYRVLVAEATAVFAAAGIDVASRQEDVDRRGSLMTIGDVPGHARAGGSSWQSLERGAGSIETDYLNGEIVLLGRLHGVPTPANVLVCGLASQVVQAGRGPGSMQAADLVNQVRSVRADV